MDWRLLSYAALLLLTSLFSVIIAYFALRLRDKRGGLPLGLLMLVVAEWSFTLAFEAMATTIPAKVLWAKIEYLGITSAPVFLLLFALEFTHRDKWLKRGYTILYWIIPLISLALAFTNEWHHLIWTSFTPIPGSNLIVYGHGAWFWIMVTYDYLVLFTATILLLRAAFQFRYIYRRQAITLFVGMFPSWLMNILYVFDLGPPGRDLTPIGFALTGLLLTWSLARLQLLDLTPVARDKVIEGMRDGVLVLDAQNRIVDINPAAQKLIGVDGVSAIGQHAEAILTKWTGLEDCRRDSVESEGEVFVDGAGYIEWRTLALQGRGEHPAGQLLILREITERKRAEENLRESEAKYSAVVENSKDAIIVLQKGVIKFLNSAIVELSGYDLEELVGSEFQSLISPEYRKLIMDRYKERLSGKVVPTRYEMEIIRKDGILVPIEVSNTIMAYEGEAATLCFIRDVTERKRAEEALRESEEQFRAIFETALDSIFIKDRSLRYTQVNPGMEKLFGLPVSNIIGRTDKDLFGEEAEAHIRDVDSRVLGGEIVEEEHTKPVKGVPKTFHVIKVPMRDRSGEIIGLCGIARDVTERVQAEEERERLLAQIREQAQQVQQIMDTAPEGMLLLDADLHLILANPPARECLSALADVQVGDILRPGSAQRPRGTGQALTHLGGRPLTELLTSPPKGLWHEVTVAGSVGPVTSTSSVQALSAAEGDRPERTFEIIARPAAERPRGMEAGPKAGGWVLVLRDVTQERAIQQRAQQQDRLAAVGQLAAGIAHDFNNIMAVILLYSEMSMKAPNLSDKVQQRLETIVEQARQASTLIGQVLAFSRQSPLKRRALDLTPFLKETVKMLRRTLPEHIQIDLGYGSDEYVIDADPTSVQQVIMNLAINSRDAMPEGGSLLIRLERMGFQTGESPPLPEMEPGEWVRMTVADSGTGVPADVLPHIFDPFFTTKEPGEGTGLGLAQVHGIVRQHGGHIDVTSQVGRGTTFVLYLPALPVPEAETLTEGGKALVGGQGETVLVVEDDPPTREAVRAALEVLNYRVLEAANGREALEIFEQRRDEIALVMSDLVMPEMGGKALLRALRKQDPAVKVIIMSGHPLKDEKSRPMEGVVAWMQKPLRLEQLDRVMAQALAGEGDG